MTERLRMAHDVAWAKWARGLPVRDPAREAALMKRVAAQAEATDLHPDATLQFLKAQIEASCLEQERWMTTWRARQDLPTGEPPSLDALRLRINSQTSRLIAEWAATQGTKVPRSSVKATLITAGISPTSAGVAATGFR